MALNYPYSPNNNAERLRAELVRRLANRNSRTPGRNAEDAAAEGAGPSMAAVEEAMVRAAKARNGTGSLQPLSSASDFDPDYISRRATDRVQIGDLNRMQQADLSRLYSQGLTPDQKREIQIGMRERSASIAGLANASGPKGIPLTPDEKRAMIQRGMEQTNLLAEQDRRRVEPSRADYARQVQGEYDAASQARSLGFEGRPATMAEYGRLAGAGTASRLGGRLDQIEENRLRETRPGPDSSPMGPQMTDEAIAARIKALSEAETQAQMARRQSPDFQEQDALERATRVEAGRQRATAARTAAAGEIGQEAKVREALRSRQVEEARGAEPTTDLDRIARQAEVEQAQTTADFASVENAVIRGGYTSMEQFNTDVDTFISNLEGSIGPSDFLGVFYDDEAIAARGSRIVDTIRQMPDRQRQLLARQILQKMLQNGELATSTDAAVTGFIQSLRQLAGE